CSQCEKCLRTQIAISFFTNSHLPTFGPIRLDCVPGFKIVINDRHHWIHLSHLSARYLGKDSLTYQSIQTLLKRNYIDPQHPYTNRPFFVRLSDDFRLKVRYWKQKIKYVTYSSAVG